MDLGDFFRILEDLELKMADLYEALSKCVNEDAEAVEFFKAMKQEELAHRDVVKMSWRLASKNKYSYNQVEIDKHAEQFKKNLSELKILTNAPQCFSVEEALRISLKLESSMFDRHRTMVLDHVDKQLASFVRQLGASDQKHIERLNNFAESRGLKHLVPDSAKKT